MPKSQEHQMRSRSIFVTMLAVPALIALLAWSSLAFANPAAVPSIYLPLLCGARCASRPTLGPEQFEARVIELANEARIAAGCPVAVVSDTLMRATGDWSSYMQATSDYRHSAGDFYPSYGYQGYVLEMIGGGDTPEYAFDRWMASPNHKRGIEYCLKLDDPAYRPDLIYEIGVGYAGAYSTLSIGVR